MIVTERAAEKLWCPFARVMRIEADPNDKTRDVCVGPANRDALGRAHNPIGSCRCIASRCMAWTWIDPEFEVRWTILEHADVVPSSDKFRAPEGDGWLAVGQAQPHGFNVYRQAWKRATVDRQGCCGMAPGRGEQE